jgi:MscS family membrane protein
MSLWLTDTLILFPNWKWLALLLSIVGGFLFLGLCRQLFLRLKNKFSNDSRLPKFFRILLKLDVQKPLSWVMTAGFWHFCIETMQLPEYLTKYLNYAVQIVWVYHLIHLAYLAVEALGHEINDFVKTTENTLDDQLAPFVTKSLKVFVIIFGVLIALQSFGFNVMSLLAGLGIGGLALALAAQDTAANVFGSITIILDRPFQVGDHIKVTDVEGTVEEVGFRSTSVRTFYNSVVSIPNSVMAKEKIDNMGTRPMRRIRHVLGLEYGTPIPQMKQYIDKIRYVLTSHPKIRKDNIVVAFQALGDFSLQILVNFHVMTLDTAEEKQIEQEVLFDFMKAAEECKVEFAFPTQTLHVKTNPPSHASV